MNPLSKREPTDLPLLPKLWKPIELEFMIPENTGPHLIVIITVLPILLFLHLHGLDPHGWFSSIFYSTAGFPIFFFCTGSLNQQGFFSRKWVEGHNR
jgi:hypothetical protein